MAEEGRVVLGDRGQPVLQAHLFDLDDVPAVTYLLPVQEGKGLHHVAVLSGCGGEAEIVFEEPAFGNFQAFGTGDDAIEVGLFLDLYQPLEDQVLISGRGLAPDEVQLHLFPHRLISQSQLLGGFRGDDLVHRFGTVDLVNEGGVADFILLHRHPERPHPALDRQFDLFALFRGEPNDEVAVFDGADSEEVDIIPAVGEADFDQVFGGRGDHRLLVPGGGGQGRPDAAAGQKENH